MGIRRTALRVVAGAIGVLPLVACGQERGGATTAPTSLAASGTPVTTSSSVFRTRDHGGGGGDDGGGVEGEERVSSLVTGTSCPALSVMIGTVKVSLTASTVFEAGTCADIAVGAKLHVRGTRQADGSVVATAVEVKHQDNAGNPVAGESRVTSFVTGTSCPTLSVMAGTFKVSFTATTVFERGSCAEVVVGSTLRVRGTTQADGSIVATNVEVEVENEPVEGEDVITGIKSGTSCPTLTFTIGSKAISVTTATVFDRGTCDDLKVGARVHVKGAMTGDNVVATRIQVQQAQTPGRPAIEGDGRVSSLVAGTSCPALRFKAEEEWTVALDASTTFVGGACADIAVGRKVSVKGTVTGEHQVLASQIVFKGPGDNCNAFRHRIACMGTRSIAVLLTAVCAADTRCAAALHAGLLRHGERIVQQLALKPGER